MAATHLIAVPTSAETPHSANSDAHPHESGAHRIRELQQQAKGLAREEMSLLSEDMFALAAHAAEVSEGGEAYPPGVRELTTRIAEELGMHAKVLRAILDRNSH